MSDVTPFLTELGIRERISDDVSKASLSRQFIPELNRPPDGVFYDYFYANQIPEMGVSWSEFQDQQNWDFKHKLLPLMKNWATERWPAGPGTVLDLGCGSGLDVCYLGRCFPQKQFIGLDSSPPVHAHVEGRARKLGLGNLRVQITDAFGGAALDEGVRCDAVILNNILDSSFPSARVVAGRLRRVRELLPPSGTIWLSLSLLKASESDIERCLEAACRRAALSIDGRGSFDYSQGARQVRHLWWSLGCLAEQPRKWWPFWW